LEQADKVIRAKTMLLYVGIFSIIMLFAGLTSAYVVTMGSGYWVEISLPKAFYYSTITIILSSLIYWRAFKQLQENKVNRFRYGLIITFFLGLTFAYFQFQAYSELIEKGNYFSGDIGNIKGEYGTDYTVSYQGMDLIYEDGNFYFPGDYERRDALNSEINKQFNSASGYLYVLSFLHLLHLIGGLIYLLILIIMTFLGRITSENQLKPKLAGIYWHFLDFLWIYLFFFLLFIH
jgi:cytochrome c oxidase subunit 3